MLSWVSGQRLSSSFFGKGKNERGGPGGGGDMYNVGGGTAVEGGAGLVTHHAHSTEVVCKKRGREVE